MSNFSKAESRVLELAMRGLSNAEIASRLDVTVGAVKFQLTNIYRKTGLKGRARLLAGFAVWYATVRVPSLMAPVEGGLLPGGFNVK